MQNNIVNIQNFISDKSLKNLIINYTSEELLHFYLETIKSFSKEERVVIRNYNEESKLDINSWLNSNYDIALYNDFILNIKKLIINL